MEPIRGPQFGTVMFGTTMFFEVLTPGIDNEFPVLRPAVELTRPFATIFDGIRPVSRVNPNEGIVFLDSENDPVGFTMQTGYYIRPLSDGTGDNDKTFMLYMTDRAGMDSVIYSAERFLIGNTRYERVGGPSAPMTNPALWMVMVKPVKRRIT